MTPLVVGAQGAALLGSCAYAILSATLTILHGGNTPDAASGLVFAAVNMIAVLVVTVRLRRARPATDLVRAEAAGWSAAVPRTVGILAGFVAILALTGTRWRWAVPYIDPIMVLAACALAVPTAMTLLRACLDELLERAPGAHIEDPIRAEVANVATRFGLTDTTVRVSKLGPKLYVEVDAMTSTERMTVADADLAKGLLRRALTVPGRKLWLNFEIHSELS
jgi:predicted Co/Zn/Cd cation transporter (cation efflux family)